MPAAEIVSVTVVVPVSTCACPPTWEVTGPKVSDTQPFWNVVGMFATFTESSTFELLNVMTFAS